MKFTFWLLNRISKKDRIISWATPSRNTEPHRFVCQWSAFRTPEFDMCLQEMEVCYSTRIGKIASHSTISRILLNLQSKHVLFVPNTQELFKYSNSETEFVWRLLSVVYQRDFYVHKIVFFDLRLWRSHE
jgi:hypothetical protein